MSLLVGGGGEIVICLRVVGHTIRSIGCRTPAGGPETHVTVPLTSLLAFGRPHKRLIGN